nr:immunoglobulin heavy chain junction region [Macaca mulatta]MOW92573.1 immunoglobulin heavy chain junction region [Macaca mulatta]
CARGPPPITKILSELDYW